MQWRVPPDTRGFQHTAEFFSLRYRGEVATSLTTSSRSRILHSTAPSLAGWATGFMHYPLSGRDGRCVQGPGTYSPQHADLRLLATPTSWGRVADPNPNYDRLFPIRSPLRVCSGLYRPL